MDDDQLLLAGTIVNRAIDQNFVIDMNKYIQ